VNIKQKKKYYEETSRDQCCSLAMNVGEWK